MIVVDTNIIAALYLHNEYSRAAEQLWRKDPLWAVPVLWRSEFLSVLTQYIRKGLLSLDDAALIAGESENAIEAEYQVPSSAVLACSSSSGCSSYDCEFIVLAEHLGVPLVSLDQQISREHPGTAVALEEFLGH